MCASQPVVYSSGIPPVNMQIPDFTSSFSVPQFLRITCQVVSRVQRCYSSVKDFEESPVRLAPQSAFVSL